MQIAPARFRRNGVVHRENRPVSMRGLRKALLQQGNLDRLEIARPWRALVIDLISAAT
jgi:hypothetical protein